MNSLKRSYRELVELTGAYLLQEHGLNERIFTNFDTFDYFRSALKLGARKEITPNKKNETKKLTPNPSFVPLEQKEFQKDISPLQPQTAIIAPSPVEQRARKEITSSLEPKVQAVEITTPSDPQKAINNKDILLEATPALKKWDLSEIRKNVSENLPYFQIIDNIPQDLETKEPLQKKVQETSQVVILNFNEEKSHQKFLTNISDALRMHGIKVRVIANHKEFKEADFSKEKPLVLASNKSIQSYNNYLSECPLHLLSDIERYFNEPSLKITLWKALKEHLKIS